VVETAVDTVGTVGETVTDTVSTVGDLVGGLLGGDDAQPDIFEAVDNLMQSSDGLTDSLISPVSFIGQSIVDTGEHHDTANPHGSLLHLFT
jgi:hypothetical protein